MQSLGERLAEVRGIGPGFGHLRIFLALAIFTWHSFGISYGLGYQPRLPVYPLLAALLPMFFALSGFLVMGSALRVANLKTFITFRALRIVPALLTEITISALILGPCLTAFPIDRYFRDPMFAAYFGSLIGRVRFSLPGLFIHNPAPQYVNFALWTVAPEVLCYVILASLILTGLYRRPRAMLAVTAIALAIAVVAGIVFPVAGVAELLPSKMLILAFLVGNLVFVYCDRIPFSRVIAVLGFGISTCATFATQKLGVELFGYLAIPGYVYASAVIGLSDLPKMRFIETGDYSYGLYIYGFPVQQTVAYLLPGFRIWWVNLLIALPVVVLCAVASWHLIEKRFLGLRKWILSEQPAKQKSLHRSASMTVLCFCLLAAYGFFIIDDSSILPVRLVAKWALSKVGIYHATSG